MALFAGSMITPMLVTGQLQTLQRKVSMGLHPSESLNFATEFCEFGAAWATLIAHGGQPVPFLCVSIIEILQAISSRGGAFPASLSQIAALQDVSRSGAQALWAQYPPDALMQIFQLACNEYLSFQ